MGSCATVGNAIISATPHVARICLLTVFLQFNFAGALRASRPLHSYGVYQIGEV